MLSTDRRVPWPGLLILLGVSLAYANSLQGVFVYDDFGTIVGNPHLESLWPLSWSMSAPPGSGSSGRPVVALSFALNYAFGEREVFGYHLVNVVLHALCALLLYGVLRRALQRLAAEREPALPPTLAATCASLLWAVHPLTSSALNHVTYRNEVLLALFFLACVYSALRGFAAAEAQRAGASRGWFAAAVACCALAMGCKEIAVGLPLVVLAVQVCVFGGGWLGALRRHAGLYAGLASTWLLLAWIVSTGDRGESVGAGAEGVRSLDYLRTQAGVLVHYLRLAFWPEPLVLDYRDWSIVRDWKTPLLPGLAVLVLFGLTLAALVRRRPLGAAAVAAFALLAPTSSFIPITGAVCAEHRLYLPLAAVVLVAGSAFVTLLVRLGVGGGRRSVILGVGTLLLGAALTGATVQRNADYRSGVAIWADTVEKRPNNSLAWTNYANALRVQERHAEAEEALRRSAELNPGNQKAWRNLGHLLRDRGDLRGAVEAYRGAVRARPDQGPLQLDLGNLLVQLGDWEEGLAAFDEALERGLPPEQQAQVAFQLATVRATAERAELRDGARALQLATWLVEQAPTPRHLDLLASAQAESGELAAAVRTAERAQAAARTAGRTRLVEALTPKLEAYRAGRPWRQAVR